MTGSCYQKTSHTRTGLFLLCWRVYASVTQEVYTETSVKEHFNQVPVPGELQSPILAGSNTSDMGSFLAALLAAATFKTTVTS